MRHDVKDVSGSLSPPYYTNVTVAGTSIEAMVNSGSCTTIMSYKLLQQIKAKTKIPIKALKWPDVALWDYSRDPISACVILS